MVSSFSKHSQSQHRIQFQSRFSARSITREPEKFRWSLESHRWKCSSEVWSSLNQERPKCFSVSGQNELFLCTLSFLPYTLLCDWNFLRLLCTPFKSRSSASWALSTFGLNLTKKTNRELKLDVCFFSIYSSCHTKGNQTSLRAIFENIKVQIFSEMHFPLQKSNQILCLCHSRLDPKTQLHLPLKLFIKPFSPRRPSFLCGVAEQTVSFVARPSPEWSSPCPGPFFFFSSGRKCFIAAIWPICFCFFFWSGGSLLQISNLKPTWDGPGRLRTRTRPFGFHIWLMNRPLKSQNHRC